MAKGVFHLLLVPVAVLIGCSASPVDLGSSEDPVLGQNDMQLGHDAPNTQGAAQQPPVLTGTGHLDDSDPQDCFKFDGQAGQTISAYIGYDVAEQTFAKIGYNYSKSWGGSSGSGWGGTGGATVPGVQHYMGVLNEPVPANAVNPSVTICVNRETPTTGTGAGTYHLYVMGAKQIVSQNDMMLGHDAPNTSGSAEKPPVLTGTGHLDDSDPQDCFTFDGQAGQNISAYIGYDVAEQTFAKIGYNYSKSWGGSSGSGWGGTGGATVPGVQHYMGVLNEPVPANAVNPSVTICVNRETPTTGTGAGTYHLYVIGGKPSVSQNDMMLGHDAPNTSGSAQKPPVLTGTGYLDDSDPQDCFKFDGKAGQTFSAYIGYDVAEQTFAKIGYNYSKSWGGSSGSGWGGTGGATVPGVQHYMGVLNEPVPANAVNPSVTICVNRETPTTGTGAGTYHLYIK